MHDKRIKLEVKSMSNSKAFQNCQHNTLTDHRMVWTGRDLEDDLVVTPLPWAGKLHLHFKCKMMEEQLKKRSYLQNINIIPQSSILIEL